MLSSFQIHSDQKCEPLKVGEEVLSTEAVFYYPIKGSKCCKQRSCVVADCGPIKKRWMYKKDAKCTENDKPDGKEDTCKERVEVSKERVRVRQRHREIRRSRQNQTVR